MSFVVSTGCFLAAAWIVFAMTREINRSGDEASQMPYFRLSWFRVFREYKALYPGGAYSARLIAAVSVAIFSSAIFVYVLYMVE